MATFRNNSNRKDEPSPIRALQVDKLPLEAQEQEQEQEHEQVMLEDAVPNHQMCTTMERTERSAKTTFKTLADIRREYRETPAEQRRQHKETMDELDSMRARLDKMFATLDMIFNNLDTIDRHLNRRDSAVCFEVE